jgi:hypothetical protein
LFELLFEELFEGPTIYILLKYNKFFKNILLNY